jgi:ABC-type Fe3+/spermidine/putrescine transport system ATPase subunit
MMVAAKINPSIATQATEASSGEPLRFAGVSKSYNGAMALHPTDLTIEAGEFLTLLGPSGSGKTTLLNLIAGYLAPSAGRLFIGEREVTNLPARQRNIGMVFQNYALFPHMTVAENVAYGLVVRKRPKAEIQQRVEAALALVELGGYGNRAIQQLSGGQQQRVALARALVIEPDVLLMDEPLGALDRQLRRNVQLELRRLHEERRRTTLYVTHDQEEALILSDRVAVMRAGRIEQIGPVQDLYANPISSFVASFIGESNLLPARLIARDPSGAQVQVDGLCQTLILPSSAVAAVAATANPTTDLRLLIRPEHLVLDETGPLTALVEEAVYLGELTALRLRLESGADLWLRRLTDRQITRGMTLRINWQPAHLRLLPQS